MVKNLEIVVVDDDKYMLEQFRKACSKIPFVKIKEMFTNPVEALQYLLLYPAQVVFLDIEMDGMSGIALARQLKARYPQIVIVFVSAYDSYTLDAVHVKMDSYLLKPYTTEDLAAVMENARLLSARSDQKVRVKCFGKFEMYLEDRPVVFHGGKARELMAILIDRQGEIVYPQEAFGIMWPDKEYNNYNGSAYRKTLIRLEKSLKEQGCGKVLNRTPHGCGINTSKVTCDYYEYRRGNSMKPDGVYLNEYPWALMKDANISH